MFITTITFILILGLLIFIHELGHFISAIKTGVKVEEFGLGFPPRIWGKKGKGGIIYSINWIPIGGFVRIKGESGESREDQDSFAHKSFWVRGLILSAGVLMNVFLAFVIFSVGYMFGLPTALSEGHEASARVRELKIQIADVVQDSPAYQAGIMVADQILKIDSLEVKTVADVQNYIKEHQDQVLSLSIKSEGEIREIQIKPEEIKDFAQGKVLGITLIKTGIISYNFFTSWYYGAMATWNLLITIIVAFYELFKNLFLGLGLTIELSGPVGVAVMTGRVVNLGWTYILQFTALLSLNLAVINFLPFPALDGGRFLFLIIEKIRRKPNNQKIENFIHTIGFSLLMVLIVVVTYRDVLRYGGGVIDKIKNLF